MSVAITMHLTASKYGQTQTKTNGEWTNHASSMLLMSDVLVPVMQMRVLS